MNKLLDLGREFLLEHIVSFGDYDMYDTLKRLNHYWFEQLHHSFFYQQDNTIKTPMIKQLVNGLYIMYEIDHGYHIIPQNVPNIKYERQYTSTCYNRRKKHGPSLVYYDDFTLKSRTIYNNGIIDGVQKSFNNLGVMTSKKTYIDGNIVDSNSSNICHKIFEYFKRWSNGYD